MRRKIRRLLKNGRKRKLTEFSALLFVANILEQPHCGHFNAKFLQADASFFGTSFSATCQLANGAAENLGAAQARYGRGPDAPEVAESVTVFEAEYATVPRILQYPLKLSDWAMNHAKFRACLPLLVRGSIGHPLSRPTRIGVRLTLDRTGRVGRRWSQKRMP